MLYVVLWCDFVGVWVWGAMCRFALFELFVRAVHWQCRVLLVCASSGGSVLAGVFQRLLFCGLV